MAWYWYHLSHSTPEANRDVLSIPGVVFRERNLTVPDNAAWLVEQKLVRHGIRWTNGISRPDGDKLNSIEELVPAGLRSWVPAFLAPYQREAVLSMAHRSGHLWHAAGSGKTLSGICWSLATPGKTLIVTRAAVRRNYAREIERFTEHRAFVIEETKDAVDLDDREEMFVVIGWEMLPMCIESIRKWKPVNVIFDECFPGDTLVSTPTGPRRIDSILPGDRVLSVDAQGEVCEREVVRTIAKRLSGELVEVTHEAGSFVCTPNHKVWTEEDGYVEAGRLDVRHHVRVVRVGERDSDAKASGPTTLLREVVQREVANGAASVQGGALAGWEDGSGEGWAVGTVADAGISGAGAAAHDRVESDARPSDGREGVVEAAGASVFRAPWWQWTGADGAAAETGLDVLQLGDRVFGRGAIVSADGHWGTTVLARLGGPVSEAGNRSGRDFAHDEEGEGTRLPQGCDTVSARVVRVAGVERERAERVGIDSDDGRVVFDLEVEGTHRYFANGTLVSNCHKAKSHRRWGATPQEDGRIKFNPLDNIANAAYQISRVALRRLATTATPIKDRVRDLWAQLDLIHPDAWGKFYKEEAASFTTRYCAARRGDFGGIDTTGSSNLDELWDRCSIVAHQVPHSVTHRHLPPRRRLVTYVTRKDQNAATGFAAYMKKAAKGGHGSLLEAKLMEAAAKKRKFLLELVEEAVNCKQKVVIFTGRREDCDKLGELVTEKFGSEAKILVGHGGTAAAVRDGMQQEYMAAPGPAILVGTGDAWGECLDIDTMILGANKPLRDCVDGDRVFGEKGVADSESATIHPYTGHMVTIKAQGLLPMRSTTGHATLTMAGGVTTGRDRHFEFRSDRVWKNAEDVKPWIPNTKQPVKTEGDFLLVPRLEGIHSDVHFDLTQFVASDDVQKMRASKGKAQELVLDADTAWVLGLYAAEGSATLQPNGQVRVTFSLGAHEQHLVKRVVGIMAQQGFIASVRRQRSWLHVTIKSTPLGHLLRKLFGTGAENKRIPEEVLLNTDLEILRSFLNGYEEGDGHTMEGGRKVQAGTVSQVLALNLQLALARFGRLASITKVQPKGGVIEGRAIKHQRPMFSVTWRWESKRHDRYKVLDKYIATPVKSVAVESFSGQVGYMSTSDKTMLASNAIVHNGVNLQDTDLALIAMLPYTPGQVIQWEGRFCRHGQKRPVLIQYLVAEGSVDEHVADILLTKLPAVEDVAKDDSVTGFADQLRGSDDEEAIIDSILSKLGVE